jgi:hypothetical protein
MSVFQKFHPDAAALSIRRGRALKILRASQSRRFRENMASVEAEGSGA